MSDTLRCPRCGRSVSKLYVCEDCDEELTREGRYRIARTVTGCAKALSVELLACMQVVLSEGRDRESMARALNARDAIRDLDAAMQKLSDGIGG